MKERTLPLLFISLLFAFLVWTSVNLGNTFIATIDVPVSIENLRSDLALSAPLPGMVRYTLQGSGWQLLNIILTPSLQYRIDLSTAQRTALLRPSLDIGTRLNITSAVNVISTEPETIPVRLEERISKRVPVMPDLHISFRQGFGIVGHIRTLPESILISGARTFISSIVSWPTVPAVLTDINAPVDLQLALADTFTFEVSRPETPATVSFDVQPIAERTIDDLPISILQAPIHKKIVLIPPKLSIIVRSGVNNVAHLSDKDFQAYIDYTTILLDTSGSVAPIVAGPEHVQIVRQNPERIQYVVRK